MAEPIEVNGYLFSIIDRIKSKSEGPEYFVQLFEEYETFQKLKKYHIVKKAELWKADKKLQSLLGHKVLVSGNLANDMLEYSSIKKAGNDY